jgi:hypothetical protein
MVPKRPTPSTQRRGAILQKKEDRSCTAAKAEKFANLQTLFGLNVSKFMKTSSLYANYSHVEKIKY